MSETIGITPKPPEVIIPPIDANFLEKLCEATTHSKADILEKMAESEPRELFCWAALACLENPKITQYAYARIGYHRGLDTLRANGWRGSGYVKASVSSNRGFLGCLALLRHYAQQIGEIDEFERCGEFLKQLDPSFNWDTFDYDNPIEFIFNKTKEQS